MKKLSSLKPKLRQKKKILADDIYQQDMDLKNFEAWCKEFNVGLLTNKDSSIEVVVGNHIKYVKLDKIF